MDNAFRVLVADDHPLYRAALLQVLQQFIGDALPLQLQEADTISRVRELLQAAPDLDLLILDLHMPGTSGLTGLAALRKVHPLIPIAVISGDQRAEAIRVAARLGAVAYLPKTLPPGELAEIIRQVLDGQHWFPNDVQEIDMKKIERIAAFACNVAALTPQQSKIYQLASAGMLNKQIGHELGIAVATVKSHVSAVLRTLHVRDRKQLIVMAKALEVYDDDDLTAS